MPRGGYRQNAGRKPLSGLYQEQTKPVRIPISKVEAVKAFLQSSFESEKEDFYGAHLDMPLQSVWAFPAVSATAYSAPLYSHSVSAGFPSPADDTVETALDLNEHLIKNSAATFFVKVNGDSMINAGIHHQDILIVDRSLQSKDQDIVIAVVNGELTVKRLSIKKGQVFLIPENPNYPPIALNEDMNFSIWGVVTTVIHSTR